MFRKARLRSAAIVGAFAAACILAESAVAPASAQTVRLEEVITAVLTHSITIDREADRVRTAMGQLRRAQGVFDWSINAAGGWQQLYVPKVRDGLLTNQLDTPSAFSTTLGVNRTFRNGISIEPGITFFEKSDATAAQTNGLTKPRPSVNITVPLFRNAGADNLLATNERSATDTLEGAGFSHDFAVQRAVYDAVQVYWRCLADRQYVSLMDADQQAADNYVASLRVLVQRGQIEPTLLDRATANQAVQRVAASRAATTDQLCRRDLAVAMGVPDTAAPIAIGDFPAMDGMTESADRLSENELAQQAYANRKDLTALVRYDAAEVEHVKGAQNSLRPKIDIYLDLRQIQLRYTRTFGRDVEQGNLAAAQATESEARLNLEQAQNQVRTDVTGQLDNLKEALTDWTALTQSTALLENVVSDAKLRAEAGVITQQEYRVTQNELTQIRRQVIDAKLQYAASLAGLRLATGTVEAGDGIPVARTAMLFRTLPDR